MRRKRGPCCGPVQQVTSHDATGRATGRIAARELAFTPPLTPPAAHTRYTLSDGTCPSTGEVVSVKDQFRLPSKSDCSLPS